MIATILASLALCVTPAEATRAALADVQAREPHFRGQMRYVACENKDQQIAVAYLCNAISHNRIIRKPVVSGQWPVVGTNTPATGHRTPATLLRIDLAAYANPRDARTYHALHAAWERLAADDPYFHVQTQVATPQGVKTVTVDGGWTGLQAAATLRALTGSAGVVLRADYFVARVAAEDYYSWAGVPAKQIDFLTTQGVEKGVIEKLAADTAANLFRSGITHKPRRVVRLPAPQGSVWMTLDVDGESPDRDPVRNPVDVDGPAGKQRFNFQASEIFYTRANGFWGVALYDAAGNRQASVPDRIAKDSEAQDGIVQPIISCIRCHEAHGKAGLQPFTDDQHPLLTGEAAILKSYLPEVAQRVGELYNPAKLNKEIERDREDYSTAVEAACGCSTQEAASALAGTFARYAFDGVSQAVAAAEAGCSPAEFAARCRASNDPITLALRSGKKVTRKAFEASYQDIMLRVSK